MSEYIHIFRSLINAIPLKAAVPILTAAVVVVTLWVASELSAMEASWTQTLDRRVTPVEEAVGEVKDAVSEQTQMLRYLACVDRRGGPDAHVRENCAADHLSERLRGILGGT